MRLEALRDYLQQSETFLDALKMCNADAQFSLVPGVRVPLLAQLLKQSTKVKAQTLLVITPTTRAAERLNGAFEAYLPDADVFIFPPWETLPHERLSPSAEIVGTRLSTLSHIHQDDRSKRPFQILIAPVRAALQPIPDNLVQYPLIKVQKTKYLSIEHLVKQLVDYAYVRVDMVTKRGEFAQRGGIIDIFSPTQQQPYRIDFFGSEVESIRFFSVSDQRSLPEELDEAVFLPSRELVLNEKVRTRAKELAQKYPDLRSMLEKISEGIPVEGMESLTYLLAEKLVPLSYYLPEGSAVAVIDWEQVEARTKSLMDTNAEFLEAAWAGAGMGGNVPIDIEQGNFFSLEEFASHSKQNHFGSVWWRLSEFSLDTSREDLAFPIEAKPATQFHVGADGASDYVTSHVAQGACVVLVASSSGRAERIVEILREREVAVEHVADFPTNFQHAMVYAVVADIEQGFEVEDLNLLVMNDNEFFGNTVRYQERTQKKLTARAKTAVNPMQLKAGDYVVHEVHGIGKFVELIERELPAGTRGEKVKREYLVLQYAPSKRGYPGDKLSVPTDQLDLLSKYVGGQEPVLSKMGGSDWSNAKKHARKAVRDIAVELVKLYAERAKRVGYAFGPDTPWQRELEEGFRYIETPDQLQVIQEVKADMERDTPMDRLISGDVGFGKTEIAIRASFKAVQEGKQVAVLVPTTLLVQQHYETFTERFSGFPVKVAALSRFQKEKEAKEVLKGLKDGKIDVVIGTHRLLSGTVAFKDLGLVIIDEEQRFGVEHKDALKKIKTNVDVLAMSATPIPRTLEMAVTGIREMSTLSTAPEDRHPILTFAGIYSDKQVAAAINRELLREGQVFFVHNRVSSINRVAAHIAQLVPEARVAVAYGKMSQDALERVVVDFWERKFDVLVTTTIIETGLDISNANTIIIDQADKYGLSQLHQLRGRVGRGRERAYAYFLWNENTVLTQTAYDRLSTIVSHNDLGSGMQVAMKDLEIRGAGNILGADQSGHIAGVGFDLYLRMIGEAVDEFRGTEKPLMQELRLELPIEASFPHEYIESERLRLEMYQKLSSAAAVPQSQEDPFDLIVAEIEDRYGAVPEQVQHLIALSRLRRKVLAAGLSEVIVLGGKTLRLFPVSLSDSKQIRLKRLHPNARYQDSSQVALLPLPEFSVLSRPISLIAWVQEIIETIFFDDFTQTEK